jgi:predicted Zn-dependent protease
MIRLTRILPLFWLLPVQLAAQPDYALPDSGKKAHVYPNVDARVESGRAALTEAIAALGRQDKGAARKSLSKAEDALEAALKANPTSRAAAQELGAVYYYEGEAGDKSGYERCTKFLGKVFQLDADAVDAPRYLALSYAKLGKARETVSFATQAAAFSSDPDVKRQMNELKRPYQDAFLSGWYEYGKYYESPNARLTQLNPKTYQLELVAQITPQFEQDLAARGLQALEPQLTRHQDPELQGYLQKLVDKLVTKSPGGPPFNYQVEVVESQQVNAMAFPGRIFVNTGLLKFVDSEAELVTILSHELAHIYAHHSARALVASYQKRMIASAALNAAGVNNSNLKETLLNLGVGIGLELLDKGYSRGEEKEADKLGTHIAFNAGYNPTFMTKFFLRLYEANPKQPFRLLSTHPPTPDRIQYTTAYLEAFPLDQEMQIDSQEFKNMKQRVK